MRDVKARKYVVGPAHLPLAGTVREVLLDVVVWTSCSRAEDTWIMVVIDQAGAEGRISASVQILRG